MDKAVQPIDASHEAWEGHEELLNRYFPRDVQSLFEVNQLKGMPTSNMDRAFDDRHSCECAAELVDLLAQTC